MKIHYATWITQRYFATAGFNKKIKVLIKTARFSPILHIRNGDDPNLNTKK
jgi:hypothetical protein